MLRIWVRAFWNLVSEKSGNLLSIICVNSVNNRCFSQIADKSFQDALISFAVNWSIKAKRRKTTGTGRMRYLKKVFRRFR